MALDAWIAPVAALLAVSALAFVAFRLYGRWVGGERAADRLRHALVVGLTLVAVLVVVAVSLAGLIDAIVATLDAAGVASPLARSALVFAAWALGIVVATTAGYAGALPAALAVRELDVEPGTALRRFIRWTGSIVGLAAAFVFVVTRFPIGSTPVLVLVIVGVVGLVYVAAPWLGRLGTPTRKPTAGERRRIEAVLDDIGFEPREVVVMEVANEMPSASIRGPPSRRVLFLSDHLLDAYDDDALAVLVGANASRSRRLYHEYRLFVSVGSVLAAYLALEASSRPLLALGAVVVIVVVLLRYGSRLVYAADAEAADRLGDGVVVETYRTIADDADLGGGRVQAFLRMRPRMDDRIDRLAGDS